MKRLIRYILSVAVLAALAACIKDPDINGGPTATDDGEVVLKFAVQIPDAQEPQTRVFGEKPNYYNLDLWCVVFLDYGDPASNFLKQARQATQDYTQVDLDSPDEPKYIPFEVTLSSTNDDNAIIHFIAIDKTMPNRDNPFLNGYFNETGPENIVIPNLVTTTSTTVSEDNLTKNFHEAYWQRVPLGMAISTRNADEIEQMVSMVSPVPLIRNFTQLNVTVAENVGNFELEGFCVVNTLDKGTIAPYTENYGFPTFVDSELQDEGTENRIRIYKPYRYHEIISGYQYTYTTDENGNEKAVQTDNKIPHEGYPYIGVRPKNWRPENTAVPTEADFNKQPKVMYERPVAEDNHTYIIVKGKYKGSLTDPGERTTFYKIDIGQPDERGVFQFYHLLRNFNYTIRIWKVEGAGYGTIEEAAAGQIYNNNVSAAIETQHLLNISDGYDMMYINFSSKVLVTNKPVELWFRYFVLRDNSIEEDDQIFNASADDNNAVKIQNWNTRTKIPLYRGTDGKPTDVNPGGSGDRFQAVVWNDPTDGCGFKGDNAPVIKDAEYLDIQDTIIMHGNSSVTQHWEVIKITPHEPTEELKYQTVTLYRNGGLSRRISFFLQKPWEVKKDPASVVYGDQLETRKEAAERGLTPGEVGNELGSQLTIFFDLPEGLPKAMFPLKFVIEADRQNIENDKVGTIVVQSGTSLFETGETRIQWVKTVTLQEYDSENYEGASNVVRCRFTTTTDLAAGSTPDDTSTTVVRITNEFFKPFEVKFTRKSN